MIGCFSQCIDERKPDDPRENGYAGADACISCHKNIVDSYQHTAHHLSTAPANDKSIAGSFKPGSNDLYYRPGVKVSMEERDGSFYQVAYKNDTAMEARKFDIVVGSGRKAQTFLYWLNDKVLQLPVSYYVPSGTWANSPNYPQDQVRFDRIIPVECFECHSSYIKRTAIEKTEKFLVDHFDSSKIIYGIDCERCHGPAAAHAGYHKENPGAREARLLVKYNDLSRQQTIDMCAVCHAGLHDTKRTTFFFRPGSSLASFVTPDTSLSNHKEIDVHGNQTQLLASSACFTNSNTLTCSSCHNPHESERTDMKIFSQRCMNCHSESKKNFCRMAPEIGPVIKDNCIDCHMPAKASRLITLRSQGDSIAEPNLVRTHFISIYKEESKRFMEQHGLSK
jgi:hypothetical protein